MKVLFCRMLWKIFKLLEFFVVLSVDLFYLFLFDLVWKMESGFEVRVFFIVVLLVYYMLKD